ncbi:MAG TPA: MarR family transcriptional regulator, partial [Rhodoferax sp.]
SEDDRRSRKVRLSAQGLVLWSKLQDPIHSFYDQALKDLSFDDRLAFIHYFSKLQTNMSKL